jgi:hypothetical protein
MQLLPQNPGGLRLAPFVLSQSGTTNSSGQVTLSLQVPGNSPGGGYQGLNALANGRFVNQATFFFGSPQAGDKITSVIVVDSGSVMPSADQAGFTAYPVITSLLDPFVGSANQQIFINPTTSGFTLNPDGVVFIPAGLFVVVTAVAANNRSDTLYANVEWAMNIG